MIIGNGLIAQSFEEFDNECTVFFASGVSNSLETDKKQYERERQLVEKTLNDYRGKKFVYFSTCSIYDSSKTESQYVKHKLNVERIVAENSDDFLILRVSNAVGFGGNPNLLLNYFFTALKNEIPVKISTEATRNIIDVADVSNITRLLLQNSLNRKIVNLAYPEELDVCEIVDAIENFSGRKFNKTLHKSGGGYHIDLNTDVKNYFSENYPGNKMDYFLNLIKKYYGN